ncbi:MAG: hypothetical protein IT176_13190 [Acidobacteria bacterium]|nr:hypothetical protein [Acidobacteriota bacterium]
MTDTLPLLQEFYDERLGLMTRHLASARLVAQYDANNAYQYVINRDETQIAWLAAAIAELGGVPGEGGRGGGGPTEARGETAAQAIAADARDAQAFVERWTPRVQAMKHARHARMLNVILGETLEQKRFFDQALAGRADLLGRRGAQIGPAQGAVLPSRWIE